MTYFLKSFTDDLATSLKAQTKVAVVYGDEGFARVVESGPHVQVLEDPAGDVFDKAPTTQGGTTPSRFRKQAGVLVRIRGASGKSGATLADHRGVVDALADLIAISAEEIAHSHKLDVTSMLGTTVDDQTDDVGQNPASAYYQLRFKIVRGINKAKAIEALQGAVASSSVIAHRMVIATTAGASITNVAAGVATVSGLEGLDASFVGKTLTLAGGANAPNRGDFPIATVIDATSVTIANPNASIDSGLTWAVSDDEAAQES